MEENRTDNNEEAAKPANKENALNNPSIDELIVPTAEKSDIRNPTSEIQDMEVHHHAHHEHGKRNWKSYLREFLMLFLAVFCGFLAEYQLEHKIEREREKRYIVSMVKDLYVDTVNFGKRIRDGQEAMGMIDSLLMLLHAPNPNEHAKRMYLLARKVTHTITPYEIFDRTYSALRTSGNIRLFRDQDVADNITSYYADIPTLQSQQQYITNMLQQYMKEVNTVFDPVVFHTMYKAAGMTVYDTTDASTFRNLLREPAGEVMIQNNAEAIRSLSGTLHYLYARILSTNSNVRNQRKGAAALMAFLLDKYDLRKELKVPEK